MNYKLVARPTHVYNLPYVYLHCMLLHLDRG